MSKRAPASAWTYSPTTSRGGSSRYRRRAPSLTRAASAWVAGFPSGTSQPSVTRASSPVASEPGFRALRKRFPPSHASAPAPLGAAKSASEAAKSASEAAIGSRGERRRDKASASYVKTTRSRGVLPGPRPRSHVGGADPALDESDGRPPGSVIITVVVIVEVVIVEVVI